MKIIFVPGSLLAMNVSGVTCGQVFLSAVPGRSESHKLVQGTSGQANSVPAPTKST